MGRNAEYLRAVGRAVAVIGSGVSVALTDNLPTASWLGLIKSGINRASNFNATLPEGWRDRLAGDLQYAQENDYLVGLLSVAEQVTAALGGQESGSFRAWLREDIGNLRVRSAVGSKLTKAIDNLHLPLVTTNYDSLLEISLQRSYSTWRDAATAQQIIRGYSANVLHLHGSWEEPEAIVFGPTSYGQILADQPAQAIEKILAADNTLIFIGCGDGLNDPNFEALRTWLKKVFHSSEANHYRLCLEQESADLARQHSGEQIVPIAYGDEYSDLTSFLDSLAPEPNILDSPGPAIIVETVQQRAVEAIYARVRTETVMADHLADVETRTLDDILIPPVFLPMTAEQFAQSLRLEKEDRPKRCDPYQDAKDHQSILVVSDLTGGLTSSLEWLVAQANKNDFSLTPIVVDFRSLSQGSRPLERQVRKELRLAGVVLGQNDSLPKVAIAVDNVSSRPEKIFSRALDELEDTDTYAFCVIGCHGGSEAEILERLVSSGRSPVVRYVGKLNKRDAIKIAALVEPARADRLAAKAMRIVQSECLPRTPLTIGLLVCMLLHGDTLLSTASPTALLDAWVNLLLGRGDPHDDARFSLDSLEKANILAFLAERFVQARAGSLSEGEAIKCLDEYFEAVGWKEDPIEVLGNFRTRYLLTVSNGQVRFAQSSYLHLFAAKRAIESQDFRFKLYEDMLYFSPIIRHYAALTRNDEDLLGRVEQLLAPSDQTAAAGRNFSSMTGEQSGESSIEDLLGHLSLLPSDTTDEKSPKSHDGHGDSEANSTELMDTWFDQINDGDREPFPVEDIEDAPPVVRIMAGLSLVSNVLRDSELVKNLKLKERVLLRTLFIWGKFVDLLDSDEDFTRFWIELGSMLCDVVDIPEARRPQFIERFCNRAPVMMGFHGISGTLSSRKLLRSLDACFDDVSFVNSAASSVMGALMGYDIHEPGWANYFVRVQKNHGNVLALSGAMCDMAENEYYEEALGDEDATQLLAFLVAQYSQKLSPPTAADRKVNEAKIAQKLKHNRILTRTRRVGLSAKTVLTEIDSPDQD